MEVFGAADVDVDGTLGIFGFRILLVVHSGYPKQKELHVKTCDFEKDLVFRPTSLRSSKQAQAGHLVG